jgi:RHH-type proline utilization regulon transcriptional repressor/proline dehydrogenase/delta 1-pyrroline-5-carboxylate dehydrogenase
VVLVTDEELISRSCHLAADLLAQARALGSPARRRRQRRLRRLLASASGARLVFNLADRVLRPVDARTAAAQLADVAAGPLEGLSATDAGLLRLAGRAAAIAPFPVIALVGARLRRETRDLVFPAEPRLLDRRLGELRSGGRRPNLNLLGEAVLGDEEAARRCAVVESLLRRDDVDCVSVKVSAIAAGLSLLDFEGSVARVCRPLQHLYRAAAAGGHKLVNLDMEEHGDLDVTVESFIQALSAPDLAGLSAGIALQAYLPDSHAALTRLLSFAALRAQSGGAPVRVRLVKGANLAMENTAAELAGWPPAPYSTKGETDASYKALLDRLLEAARGGSVRVGVASHNLFDVAFALTVAEEFNVEVEVEMLAGMADEQAAAVAARTGQALLYTPIVSHRDYRNALAYLARRLDENATPGGFLRQVLELEVGTAAWDDQASRFAAAVRARHRVRTTPRHGQDRSGQQDRSEPGGGVDDAWTVFVNEPGTDLTIPANRQWALSLLASPLPWAPTPLSSPAEVDAAVGRAAAAAADWEDLGTAKRGGTLLAAANVMAAGRGDAIAVMVAEAGKTLEEADPEVSEGVDYARWYGGGGGSLERLLGEVDGEVESKPLGVVVVAPPWNFPYAIPAGGALAALAAGNTVLLKPAPEAPATAGVLVHQLHVAGFGEDVLQLVPVTDGDMGRRLVAHPGTAGVILTGSYETAGRFARWAPRQRLLAETSGKNSLVVSATADVDQAVRDLVASAFGHAGQKCSAASLAIVTAPVYDKSPFLRQLADAVRSLRVGQATGPATQIGPIVGPFTPALEHALTQLGPGESWLVKPRRVDGPVRAPGAQLWSPGVRLGVRPGSWAHKTEWFGPVLGVMRAANLDQALAWQNAVPYGLTAGLSALSPGEHRRWANAVEAGNLYINRPITGAVVGRQPFGGWKRSSHGPTAKAGGLNYLIGLRRWQDAPGSPPSVREALVSYRRWWGLHFGHSTEMAGLGSESNELRYRSFRPGVMVRAADDANDDQLRKAVALAELTGTPVRFSVSTAREALAGTTIVVESDESFAAGLGGDPGRRTARPGRRAPGRREPGPREPEPRDPARLRVLGTVSPSVYMAAAEAGVSVLDEPICSCGRIELVRWVREQVLTRSLHRYGNVVY